MPYWINGMFAATPALAWMFLGLGLPWALAVLPRRDWRDRALVAVLTLAFGPALLTGWMFILGQLGSADRPLIRLEWIVLGTAGLALAGWALAWRKRATNEAEQVSDRQPLASDEKLLIALIGAALVIRWLATAYWPFTAYDALWVYGYQGRLYTLVGHIPNTIGYYPQFMPLQYTFLQLAAAGAINDHAARAAIPWFHLGSILTTFALGRRLFNRRAGIFAAALWALYPHVGEWARFGDLEIPLTFLFTLTSLFFLLAWTAEGDPHRRRYVLIAGLTLGIGLWTKPTMGAFVWGVLGLLALDLARRWWAPDRKPALVAWRARLQLAALTGAACIPLGSIWYMRNVLLGHNAIDFPPAYWLSIAARSGVELGWPLLAALALTAWVVLARPEPDGGSRLRWTPLGAGLALILAAVAPSILNSGRVGIVENRMGMVEWLILGVGVALLAHALGRYAHRRWSEAGRTTAARLAWMQLLALPYFITWFISYSYHYRLSFAIVPLLLMPTAVIAAHWTANTGRLKPGGSASELRRGAYLALMAALGLPGTVIALRDGAAGWDWLWTDKLPDDHARYTSGNAALMAMVDGLQIYLNQPHDEPLTVIAPGIVRLPFFFPLEDIRTAATPTHLSELEGATYFMYGMPETRGAYEAQAFLPNQVTAALSLAPFDDARRAIMRRAWWYDDGTFNYTVYELHLENRFRHPTDGVPPPEGDVIFGGFLRYLGHDIGGDFFWPGRRLIMHLYWETLAPPPDDYMVYIHLRAADGQVWQTWDGPVTRSADGSYYSTLFWEPGEFVVDERLLTFDSPEAPVGEGYTIVIGLYSLATKERVPLTINGAPAGDGYTIPETIAIIAEEPGS